MRTRKQHACQNASRMHTDTHAHARAQSHTHTRECTHTCESWLNILMCYHLSALLLHKHTQMVGGKYCFILSIFKSSDDRNREGKTHTLPLWFQIVCVCVCVHKHACLGASVNHQARYHADDRHDGRIKSW